MSPRSTPTRAATRAAALALPLALLAGCSGGDDTSRPDDQASTSGTATSAEPGSETTEGGTETATDDATDDATDQAADPAERLRTVVTTQLDFASLPAQAFGAIPAGLPEGVLPADQDPNLVVGMGDAEGGWVVFVQGTTAAAESLQAASQRLVAAGYAAGPPVAVGDTGELAAPGEADPGAFGDLATFSRDTLLVGVSSRDVDVEQQVALPSVTIYVVSPS